MISVSHCNTYELSAVKKALQGAIDRMGGLSAYCKPGETVLLKVNLIMAKKPEDAATTHPSVVQALTELLQEHGCQVVIGDSPGGPFLPALLKKVYQTTGMTAVAERTGATLNFDTTQTEVDFPEGKLLKHIIVGHYVTEVDHIFSVAKLKSHCMTKMTGATKNLFGIIPGTVKAEYHFRCPQPEVFADCLLDICGYAKPTLSFLDAVIGMEGHGPTGGNAKALGALLVSESPYELDLCASDFIGLPLEDYPMGRQMVARGLCPASAKELTMVGDDLEPLRPSSFEIPQTESIHFLGNHPPKFLEGFVKRNLHPKPTFRPDRCVGCGVCVANCPAKVLTMKNHLPQIDLEHCIRCYCCQELCPQKAVDIRQPLLLRLFRKF